MLLSERTKKYIESRKTRLAIVERNQIIEIFQESNLPIFEPVISFQENFAGVIESAGLAPIIFGIIPSYKPEDVHFTQIDAEICDDRWHFRCADTLYQMWFEIDELGRMFEDGELVANTPSNYFANLAFEEELKINNYKTGFSIYEPKIKHIEHLVSFFELKPFDEIFDEGTKWYVGEAAKISIRAKTLSFFAKNNYFEEVRKLGISKQNIKYLYWTWETGLEE